MNSEYVLIERKYLSRLEKMERDLKKAIKDEGPAPQIHRKILDKHRSEWPTLWKILDRVVK